MLNPKKINWLTPNKINSHTANKINPHTANKINPHTANEHTPQIKSKSPQIKEEKAMRTHLCEKARDLVAKSLSAEPSRAFFLDAG